MTDKVQKICEEVEKRYEYWREKESNSHSIESEIRMSECKHLLLMLDSLQEEPFFKVGDIIQKKDNNSIRYSIINKTSDGYHALRGLSDTIVIWFSEQDQWELVEEPISEDFEEALAREWQGYNDRGAATVDALEDNTQELAFAKGFYRGAKWQEEKDDEDKVLIYKHGFDDCKEQMITKAIDAQCFGFQGSALFSFRLPADNYLVGSEVKVIVIKED